MKTILVTGSRGLVGSAVCDLYRELGWNVVGIDNGQRGKMFGAEVVTDLDIDIRWSYECEAIIQKSKPDAIVHCAAQPSHDYAATHVFEDFDINARGTLNLLEAARWLAPEAPFVFLSTNKVYGDGPNFQMMEEKQTRFVADGPIGEDWNIDQSMHSLFGCSKLAADMYVQEYGRYFGMKTCCLRCGCLTGPNHAGVEQHGFLSYLLKCAVYDRPYIIYGHQGKQVRDNLHAYDVARFVQEVIDSPVSAGVYNLGGGPDNSISVLEAIERAEKLTGRKMQVNYDPTARKGDHICYVSDLAKCNAHYPNWTVTKSLDDIFSEIIAAWQERKNSE